MNKRYGFIFPGQGVQYVGMGRDFYEKFEEAQAVFHRADALLKRPFSQLVFEGPNEELVKTKNSQLAIFITSIAILRTVQSVCSGYQPAICGGLSLGEYTALVASGKISFEEALLLVEARGLYMEQACISCPGTMNAVLGLDLDQVEEVVDSVPGVWIANLNCPLQVVISGNHEGIIEAGERLKKAGARRILPLDVSGAFHSGLMKQAQERLEPLISSLSLHRTDVPIVMNVSGDIAKDKADMRTQMVEQVTSPVYWEKSIGKMLEKGVEGFIEMGSGTTLSGMNKRIGVKVPTLTVEKVEDMERVLGHEVT